MFTETLLFSGWRLTADEMPEELIRPEKKARFVLPGMQELRVFSDLLGGADEEEELEKEQAGAPFALPGKFPDGVSGCACLSREIDFGRMKAEHAEIEIDQLCGSGSILLGEERLADFEGGRRIGLDLTDALRLGRKQTLYIRFDEAQSAGIYGAVVLRTRDSARIEGIVLSTDEAQQILSVAVNICAGQAGVYALRAALAGTLEDTQALWRESRVNFDHAGEQTLRFTLSMRAPGFTAGMPYHPPVLKMFLFFCAEGKAHHGVLMDSRTVMTGYPGKKPDVYVPLMREECALAPDELIAYAKKLHISALYAPYPVSDLLVRRAVLEGMMLLTDTVGNGTAQGPAVVMLPDVPKMKVISGAQVCWELCAMTLVPPVVDESVTDREMMLEAAGREIDAGAPNAALRIAQLRALRVRLKAEAARQGHYTGALCMPGEWREAEIAKALTQALCPLHLSVLPQRGAWWTQTMFSASLHVFIPDEMKNGTYTADAALLNEMGEVVASFRKDVTMQNEKLGVIEARLPDHPCVLTLRTQLLRSGAAVETQEIPVYVGERGPLEAAFE